MNCFSVSSIGLFVMTRCRTAAIVLLMVWGAAALLEGAEPGPAAGELWGKLQPYCQAPPEWAGKLGSYRSPLEISAEDRVESAEEWAERRQQILEIWQRRLGGWPPLVERPKVERLASVDRDGYVEHHVQVQVSTSGHTADGYLLIPRGDGPFPAVLVPFYEPLTSIGRGAKGQGTHDYGLQLTKRGFVTLSIGSPGSVEGIGVETGEAAKEAGAQPRRQPLSLLAYAAANCHTALAQLPVVNPERIGIVGLSYGGKWSMFASCLYDKFACAVWSDPGIVFNEQNANVNYWDPWYLGFDPEVQRKPGIPSETNPRTGLYKELIDEGEDMVSLHALMAPRPVLISGGTEDPPENWQALNHLVAVNEVLGYKDRVAMTKRSGHIPTPEALEIELTFLEYWLKYGLR
jgi:dienelactone hydrolase